MVSARKIRTCLASFPSMGSPSGDRHVKRGVGFVQVAAGGWDHHAVLARSLPTRAGDIDGPAAALIKDLKQRGLLDSTLVIWGGEFGRTVTRDRNGGATAGRDHN